MIIEEIRNIKSEKSDLKKFGLFINAILFRVRCICGGSNSMLMLLPV